MKLSQDPRVVLPALLLTGLVGGCSSGGSEVLTPGAGGGASTLNGGSTAAATGGSTATGGSSSAGGTTSTGSLGGSQPGTGGGLSAPTGGAVGAGGQSATGGSKATGGVVVSAGGKATGGTVVSAGGQVATGGSKASGGTVSAGGQVATGGATSPGGGGNEGPCDIYAAASTPCAAAFSMVRALSKSYTGPLFQVRTGSSTTNRGTGGTTIDIGTTADGYADRAAEDAACNGTVCTVSKLYDQSGNGSHLTRAPKGATGNGTHSGDDCYESSATKGEVTAGGHKLYSLYMDQFEGYRLAAVGKNMPLKTAAQGIYMLADGTHYGTACCWDFGNVTTNPLNYHTMNTLFLGTGFWGKGTGSGPWFLADFEGGVWAGGSGASSAQNNNSPSMKVSFALGMLKTSPGNYTIRVADTATASALTTANSSATPMSMDNQGGITLGVGGDNSNNSWGTFFEGAITVGAPTEAADLAVLKNIQAVGYKK